MNTISVSQLRAETAKLLARVTSGQEASVIMQRSKPKAVLVDYNYYQALEEAALDASDAREAEQAKKEKKLPLKTYLKKRFGPHPQIT
jgi:prevent-host-death family protein